jgi:hypothetical protein
MPQSLKERHFHLVGEEFLFRFGQLDFFLETKLFAHYPEILRSWQAAINAYEIDTPAKNLKTDSAAERDELALLFIELRYGEDPANVPSKYAALYRSRANDLSFWRAIAKTKETRSQQRPFSTERDLSYLILARWLYGFLAWLTHEDQVQALVRGYGVAIDSRNPVALVTKTVERLGVLSWSDFPQTYSQSPLIFRLWAPGEHGGKHGACQFLRRLGGQSAD